MSFDIESVIDGWVFPEQPAAIFAQGRQANMPVVVGSNSDEATTVIEETLHGPPASDADARAAFIAFDTDYELVNSVHVMAHQVVRAGQKA